MNNNQKALVANAPHDFVSDFGSEFCDRCGRSVLAHNAEWPVSVAEHNSLSTKED